MLKQYYRKTLPEEFRLHISAKLHPIQHRRLITQAHQTDKAIFSMRKFDAMKAIFVHVTKTGGTAIAQSLVGEQPYHYRAIDYRAMYGRKRYNEYFKFGFVRNPWDRLFSAWSYLSQGGWHDGDVRWFEENLARFGTFEEFVMGFLNSDSAKTHIHFLPQHAYLCDSKHKVIVDYVGRFETLSSDFDFLKCKLELRDAKLTTKNAASKSIGYEDAYTEKMIERVRSIYSLDCEVFGYDFKYSTSASESEPNI